MSCNDRDNDRDMIELLGNVLPAVANQMRLPLSNIHGAAAALIPPELREQDEACDVNAAILYQGYYRLLRVMNNLASASILKESTPFVKKNLELVQWLREICLVAEPVLREKKITMHYSCDLTAHIVAVEKYYLERLVWNLLSNAAKYTPKGGKITVSLRLRERYVYLSVADTGCGMTDEEKKAAFSRYAHCEPSLNHGIGLGLPLCWRIAEGHGGRLVLESVKGQGTCVTVCLPDERSDAAQLRDHQGFDYHGGFQPHLVELADALSYQSFLQKNMD